VVEIVIKFALKNVMPSIIASVKTSKNVLPSILALTKTSKIRWPPLLGNYFCVLYGERNQLIQFISQMVFTSNCCSLPLFHNWACLAHRMAEQQKSLLSLWSVIYCYYLGTCTYYRSERVIIFHDTVISIY
jgi:hypothetical protein